MPFKETFMGKKPNSFYLKVSKCLAKAHVLDDMI